MAERSAMKIGIAGLGRKGMHHLERLSLRSDFAVAAVHDAAPSRAALAEHLCGQFVPSREEFLADPRFDTVLVATPPASRAAFVRAALASGKHAAVESPLGFDQHEAEEIRSLSARAGRRVAILPASRFDPDFATVMSLVKSGALGRVLAAKRILWGRRVAAPDTIGRPLKAGEEAAEVDPERAAGFPAPLVEPMTACFEQVLALIDEPVRSVFATWGGSHHTAASFQTARAMAVRMRFQGGATAEIDLDIDSLVPLRTGWVLSGTDGGYKKLRRYQRSGDQEIFDVPVQVVEAASDGVYDELAAAAGDIAKTAESPLWAGCGWKAIHLLELARRSAETGQAIEPA